MSDTLDLLETIGRDASLRHASAEELARMLEQAQASEALTSAVVLGDRAQLFAELGHRPICEPPQVVQTHFPGHEEEEEDAPEEDGGKDPQDPRAPNSSRPAPRT